MATIFDSVTSLFAPKENSEQVEERKELSSQLSQAVNYLTAATLILVPLLVVPFLADSYELPKNTLLLGASLIGFTLWLGQGLLTKRGTMTRSIFDLPLIAFALASVVSAFLSVNRYMSLASDPVTIVGGTLLFLLISSVAVKKTLWTTMVQALLLSGTLLGVWTAVSFAATLAAPLAKLTVSTVFLNPLFSPAGSVLAQTIYLAILLPLALGMVLKKDKTHSPGALFNLVAAITIALGIALGSYTLANNNPALLETGTAWKVATGAISQSLPAALFGVSPAHYVDAFTQHRGTEFNSSPLWNSRFATSSNFYLYLLTTLGIAGLATFAWIMVRFAVVLKKRLESDVTTNLEKGLLGSLATCLVLFALLPAPTVTLFAFFALLGLLVSYYHHEEIKAFAWTKEGFYGSQNVRAVITVAAAVLTIATTYGLGRFILADYYFGRSLQAAQANLGSDTYNLQIQAITHNEWNDNYHSAYAQTNLALADSLATQPNLTDQQKQTVVQLVQQAIREGRIAAALEPNRAGQWENLSFIYRNLINFAEGADQWSVATQNQAIALDPLQPRLKLDLGGIYFAAGDYQTAAQIFAQAVNLKPDYANAHYNLAQALRNLNLKDQALAQLQLTGALVCSPNNQAPDCVKVNAEITELGSTPASPAAVVAPSDKQVENTPLSTASGNKALEKARTTPPAKISSPSGEIAN